MFTFPGRIVWCKWRIVSIYRNTRTCWPPFRGSFLGLSLFAYMGGVTSPCCRITVTQRHVIQNPIQRTTLLPQCDAHEPIQSPRRSTSGFTSSTGHNGFRRVICRSTRRRVGYPLPLSTSHRHNRPNNYTALPRHQIQNIVTRQMDKTLSPPRIRTRGIARAQHISTKMETIWGKHWHTTPPRQPHHHGQRGFHKQHEDQRSITQHPQPTESTTPCHETNLDDLKPKKKKKKKTYIIRTT